LRTSAGGLKPTLFVDRCLGGAIVPNALRDAGIGVEIHFDHFDQETADEIWIPEVGRRGWIILPADKHIRSNQVEIIALMKSGTASFVLASNSASGSENAKALCTALPLMMRFLKKFEMPFIAGVTLSGHVNILMRHSDMIRKII
jgi:PIN like domain